MRHHYSATFKAKFVQEMLREEKTITQIAAEHGLHPNQLTKWKATALQGLPSLYDKHDTTIDLKAAHEKEVTDLYAEIGRLTTQLAWLKKKSGLDHA